MVVCSRLSSAPSCREMKTARVLPRASTPGHPKIFWAASFQFVMLPLRSKEKTTSFSTAAGPAPDGLWTCELRFAGAISRLELILTQGTDLTESMAPEIVTKVIDYRQETRNWRRNLSNTLNAKWKTESDPRVTSVSYLNPCNNN
jgi:hypothetical protein